MGPKLSDEDFNEDKIDQLYKIVDDIQYDIDYAYEDEYDSDYSYGYEDEE